MELAIATVPVITAVAFGLAQLYKLTPWNTKWIPLMCGIVGAILGVVIYFCTAEAFDIVAFLGAFASGIASGLAATGVHQAVKKLSEDSNHMDDYNGI